MVTIFFIKQGDLLNELVFKLKKKNLNKIPLKSNGSCA